MRSPSSRDRSPRPTVFSAQICAVIFLFFFVFAFYFPSLLWLSFFFVFFCCFFFSFKHPSSYHRRFSAMNPWHVESAFPISNCKLNLLPAGRFKNSFKPTPVTESFSILPYPSVTNPLPVAIVYMGEWMPVNTGSPFTRIRTVGRLFVKKAKLSS